MSLRINDKQNIARHSNYFPAVFVPRMCLVVIFNSIRVIKNRRRRFKTDAVFNFIEFGFVSVPLEFLLVNYRFHAGIVALPKSFDKVTLITARLQM